MKDLKALVLVAEEQEVVTDALREYWQQCQERVTYYREMLRDGKIPQGLTREQVEVAFRAWDEKCVSIHNLLNRLEK